MEKGEIFGECVVIDVKECMESWGFFDFIEYLFLLWWSNEHVKGLVG